MASSSQTTGTGYNLGLVTSSDLGGSTYSIVVLSPTCEWRLDRLRERESERPRRHRGRLQLFERDLRQRHRFALRLDHRCRGRLPEGLGRDLQSRTEHGRGVAWPTLLPGLATPSTSGLTNYGSVNLTSGSKTISPGIYSSIKVSNSASLTMNAGTYIIKGGGFSVSGSANVSGSGVTIYNAGSNCPSSGGTYGSINWSSTGTFNLSAPSSGTYAGS